MNLAEAITWWRARPGREKLLLGAGLVGALLATGDAALTAPLDKRLQRTGREAQALAEQLHRLQPAASADTLRQQETELRERLERARHESARLRRELADAARLPETLRAVTATVGSAQLLQLDLSGDAESGADTARNGARKLYRLPIKLEVSGSWAELQLLLAQIERHAGALQWSSLALDNSQWPAIKLTLKAHVLSTDPRWGAAS